MIVCAKKRLYKRDWQKFNRTYNPDVNRADKYLLSGADFSCVSTIKITRFNSSLIGYDTQYLIIHCFSVERIPIFCTHRTGFSTFFQWPCFFTSSIFRNVRMKNDQLLAPWQIHGNLTATRHNIYDNGNNHSIAEARKKIIFCTGNKQPWFVWKKYERKNREISATRLLANKPSGNGREMSYFTGFHLSLGTINLAKQLSEIISFLKGNGKFAGKTLDGPGAFDNFNNFSWKQRKVIALFTSTRIFQMARKK